MPWVRGDGKCVRECVREVREEEEVVRSLLVLLRRWPCTERPIPVNLYTSRLYLVLPRVWCQRTFCTISIRWLISPFTHSLSPYIKTPSFYSSSVFLSLCRPWVETVPWFSVLCGIRYHLHLCISSCVYVLSNLRIRTVTVFVYHLFYVLPSLG